LCPAAQEEENQKRGGPVCLLIFGQGPGGVGQPL